MEKPAAISVITENVVNVIDNRFRNENVPQNLLNYLYLATAGLCISLGVSYVNDIFNLVNRMSFTNKLKFYSEKNYLVLPRFNNDLQIDYQFFIRDIRDGNINTLEFIIKEMINLLCIENDSINDDDKLVREVLKNLLVEDIINTVFKLEQNESLNIKFKSVIDSYINFNIEDYCVSEFEPFVNLFRPLYKYNDLKEFFTSNLINGHYDNIYREFNEILGNNSFENMINSLKVISSKLNKKNIPTYDIACSYLNIRNKFIQSYINLKFNEI